MTDIAVPLPADLSRSVEPMDELSPGADATLTTINWRTFGIATLIFSGLSIWMMLANKSFLEADGITHYLARRFAFSQPHYFTDIWSRPLCVLLGAVPAYFGGLLATRLLSLVMVLAMAVVTLRVAAQAGLRRPTLAGLFLLTQPLLFAHSFSELTEVPFALLVVCAFFAYQQKRFGWLALLASLAPLARPEGSGVLLLVAVALVLHKRRRWLTILPIPIVLWSFFGWYTLHGTFDTRWIFWLRDNWPYSQASVYGSGSSLRFLLILPAIVGPIVFPFIWIGVWRLLKRERDEAAAKRHPRVEGAERFYHAFFEDHAVRCRMLIAIIPLGILLAHSLLWATGRMASSGEPRYMLIVAPFWALLGAVGLSWLADRQIIRRPGLIILLAVAVPVAANLHFPVLPLHVQDDEVLTAHLSEWLESHPEARRRYPRLCTAMPMLFWKFDIDRLDPAKALNASIETAKAAPDGTLLVWHSKYSNENADATLAVPREMLIANGWRPMARYDAPRGLWAEVYLSPRDVDGNATELAEPDPGAGN